MSIALQILQLYVRKRAPKDIDFNPPAAALLFFITVAIYTVAVSTEPVFKNPLMTAVTAMALDLIIIFAILHFHQKSSRFVQMITASMGVAVIGNLLILATASISELVLFRSLIQFWGIYLSIIILRDTLECSFFKSLAITFASMFVVLTILLGMFGDPQAIEQLQRQSQQSLERPENASPTAPRTPGE